MSKTIKNSFFKVLTFEKLYLAHMRAKRNKTNKYEVILFEKNLENNLVILLNKLKEGKYKTGMYRSFKIYEPKVREIQSLPYVDRVVHQWYIEEFIKPYIMKRFIFNTYACLENRGTHKAVYNVKYNLINYKRKFGDCYILKCDIKKFFKSINKDILFCILSDYITDKKLLEFTKIIIYSDDNLTSIPIGNYSSQFFANIYLDKLDKYVKNTLKCKYYTRYMDDFILILKDKNEAKIFKEKIEIFLKLNLNLELNHKSRYYPLSFGVDFCGYRIFTTHTLLRVNSKYKINRKVNKWNKEWSNNLLNFSSAISSLNSWFGHIKHCNSFNIENKIIKKCDFLYSKYTIENIENQLNNLK
ncbi:MAG: RNA-directed DNA polymerase [Clostridia bacterium]